jgi:hypothetical protein
MFGRFSGMLAVSEIQRPPNGQNDNAPEWLPQ